MFNVILPPPILKKLFAQCGFCFFAVWSFVLGALWIRIFLGQDCSSPFRPDQASFVLTAKPCQFWLLFSNFLVSTCYFGVLRSIRCPVALSETSDTKQVLWLLVVYFHVPFVLGLMGIRFPVKFPQIFLSLLVCVLLGRFKKYSK